jgi:MerR family transcriptional regulator, light-induced transcriptional regulator
MNPNSVTTRQAAQALGVSEASLKRWCDQGLLPAVRTPGGHRRLPLNGVVQFVRERHLELVRPNLLGLPGFTPRIAGDGGALRAAMQTALEGADEGELRGLLLGSYLAGTPAAEILDDQIAPAFRAIGDRWAHGAVAIYEERRAVELCIRELHQLRAFLPTPPPDAPQAIGGTLTGDPYALPTTMLEIALCEVGWRAQSYGCGLPATTLVDALRKVRPRLLWLSVSAFELEQQFLADYGTLYAAAQELGVAVLVGGRMLTGELRERIQYSAYGDNLRHAVAFVRALHPPARNRLDDGEGQR